MTTRPPRILVRADAGHRIGTGHVMRCLTIADAMRDAGAEVRFACKAHPGHLAGVVRDRGYACDLLDPTPDWKGAGYLSWLGGPVEDDVRQTAALLDRIGGADVLLMDHYALDIACQRPLRALVRRIVVIEDLPDRHHDCDLLIDQNIGHEAAIYDGRVPEGATRLVGPNYAPIAPAFAALRSGALDRRMRVTGVPDTLLIAVGGTDPDDLTGRVLTALRPPVRPRRIDIVLSGSARHLEAVVARAATIPSARMHVGTREMPTLMAEADVAVGAAGVTALERCVVGLPTLLIPIAENQISTTLALARAGAARALGDAEGVTADDIQKALVDLFARPEDLKAMSAAAARVCDGAGLTRIVPAFLDIL